MYSYTFNEIRVGLKKINNIVGDIQQMFRKHNP